MSDDHHIVVIGAGNKDVNGIYFQTGHSLNGHAVYTPSGNFEDRNNESFFIWRETNQYNNQYWCISNLLEGGRAAKDVGHWYRIQRNLANISEQEKWVCDQNGIAPPPTVSRQSLKQNPWKDPEILRSMVFSEDLSDIHFHCPDGTILHAHKAVLSATSSYFKTAFDGPWNDEHPDGVWKTTNPANFMKIILRFLYACVPNVEEIEYDSLALLSLAHEYGLSEFVQLIESIIKINIDVTNVREIIHAAVLYNRSELKQFCFDYIKSDPLRMVTDQAVMQLGFEDKELWSELRDFLLP